MNYPKMGHLGNTEINTLYYPMMGHLGNTEISKTYYPKMGHLGNTCTTIDGPMHYTIKD